jgi:methylated-DNA-[protein]-cysteine S-methyltransferase
MIARHFSVATPFGPMRATVADGVLHALVFDDGLAPDPAPGPRPALVDRLGAQIEEWSAGLWKDFDVPLAPLGTAFQRAVWTSVQAVPRGTVTSYAALARAMGRPRAARAVGAALGRNPWLLIVPCHRVVAQDGSLAGYAGGLARKRALLDLEAERLETGGRVGASAHGGSPPAASRVFARDCR